MSEQQNSKLPLNCFKTETILVDGKRLGKRLNNGDRKLEKQLKGCNLEQATNVKLLGLVIDEQLSFDMHISCGHTTDFYLGKTDLPRANSSKFCLRKLISGFVLPR